jgi:hypothetical protein
MNFGSKHATPDKTTAKKAEKVPLVERIYLGGRSMGEEQR